MSGDYDAKTGKWVDALSPGPEPKPHPLDDKLEPETRDMTDAALYSIAISLKRIADVLSPCGGLTFLEDLAAALREPRP